MNRLLPALMIVATFGLSACSDTQHARVEPQPMQLSAIAWDELAAASTAAQVNNNSLIMMR